MRRQKVLHSGVGIGLQERRQQVQRLVAQVVGIEVREAAGQNVQAAAVEIFAPEGVRLF